MQTIQNEHFTLGPSNESWFFVKSSFNPLFASKARSLGGYFDNYRQHWEFRNESLDAVKRLLLEAFGTDGTPDHSERVTLVIYMDNLPPRAYSDSGGESIYLFGRQIARRAYRSASVELGQSVTVLRGGFKPTGGSVRKVEVDHEPGTMLEIQNVPMSAVEREGAWCTSCFEILTPELREAIVSRPAATPQPAGKAGAGEETFIMPDFDLSAVSEEEAAEPSAEPPQEPEAVAAPTVRPYLPASQSTRLDTFTPANMAFEIQEALKRLKLTYGDIDKFVQQKLQYRNKEELFGYLSAEQIDAVALAIHNILAGDATIIGDQTGIGKGRIAAAVVRFAVLSGFPTVFCSEKAGLFTDLYRDLIDIGSDDLVPFIFNNDKDANILVEVEEHGTKVTRNIADVKKNEKYRAKASPRAVEALLEGENTLPPGYNFAMVTYSQFSDDYKARINKLEAERAKRELITKAMQAKRNQKTEFLRRYAKGAVFVMDESHNASGEASAIGFFTRDILQSARGVCFLSATYAKSAAALPTYAIKTTIKEAKLDANVLIQTFQKGGTALQEVVAADLVKSGQMIRRQRSFDGIKFDFNYLEEHYEKHRKVFDAVTQIIRDIVLFQREHVKRLLELLSKTGGLAIKVTSGTDVGGLNNTPYFNKVYHALGQLMFSLKAAEVAKEAIRHLNENKKVVIAFDHTMGSFLAELGYADGDAVSSHDFSLVLVKGLEGVMKYSVDTSEGKQHASLLVEDLDAEAKAEYDRILANIQSASSGVSFSPVDVLVNIIEHTPRPNNSIGGTPSQYYRVRECTGRSGRIRIEDGRAVYRSFKADKKAFFREFNSGEADVLLLNQSASTGVSCHASATFKDQRQRVMLIHEPMLRIDTMVQMLGRVNRTGQVSKPEYYYISSSVPAEKKLFMVLKKKLKSLDANTSGSQRSSEETLEVEDFYNKYGHAAIIKATHEEGMMEGFEYMRDSLDDGTGSSSLVTSVAPSQSLSIDDLAKAATLGGASEAEEKVNKFVNELAVQRTDVQERLYAAIIRNYEEMVNDAKVSGEYDLEVEFLDYQAQLKETFILAPAPGGNSVFGQAAFEQVFVGKNLRKPYKWGFVEREMKENLEGRTAREVNLGLLEEWAPEYADYAERRREQLRVNVEEAEEDLAKAQAGMAKANASGDAEKIKRAEGKLERATNSLAMDNTRRTNGEANLAFDEDLVKKCLDYYEIGKPVLVPIAADPSKPSEYTIVPGIVTNVERDDDGVSPASFHARIVLASAERYTKVRFNQHFALNRIKEATSKMTESLRNNILTNWNRLAASKDQVELNLVTNNVLLGIGKILTATGGAGLKLVKFSTASGAIINGIERSKKAIEESGTVLPANMMKDVVMASSTPLDEAVIVKSGKMGVGLKRLPFNHMGIVVQATKDHQAVWAHPELMDLLDRTPEEIREGQPGKFAKGVAGAFGNLYGATVSGENIDKALAILGALGFSGTVQRIKADPTAITGAAAGAAEPEKGRYVYELNGPFRPGAYPAEHFDGVVDHPGNEFGAIVYNQPLSPKQRYSTGLIPVFESIDQPFGEWQRKALQGAVQREFDETLAEAKAKPVDDAVRLLGRFILSYAHEDGNPEFVWGRYTLADLGRKAYEKYIGPLPAAPAPKPAEPVPAAPATAPMQEAPAAPAPKPTPTRTPVKAGDRAALQTTAQEPKPAPPAPARASTGRKTLKQFLEANFPGITEHEDWNKIQFGDSGKPQLVKPRMLKNVIGSVRMRNVTSDAASMGMLLTLIDTPFEQQTELDSEAYRDLNLAYDHYSPSMRKLFKEAVPATTPQPAAPIAPQPAPAPPVPDAAAAKAKRLRIAKMEAEAALMRVRVLKLKAQAQAKAA